MLGWAGHGRMGQEGVCRLRLVALAMVGGLDHGGWDRLW